MDWHELEKKKVTELREMAKEQGMKGVTALTKDQLVERLARELGIEKPHLIVTGFDKSAVKRRIRELKAEARAALEAHDHLLLKRRRRQIHRLKRRIRRHAHLTH